MTRIKQMIALITQELKISTRSRYIMVTFVLLPLIIWGFQGAELIYFGSNSVTSHQDETIYAMNLDQGNGTHVLGDEILFQLSRFTTEENHEISGAKIEMVIDNSEELTIMEYAIEHQLSPLILINENFTMGYSLFNETKNNPPAIDLYFFSKDKSLGYALMHDLSTIIDYPPYTAYEIEKESGLVTIQLSGEGEEIASNSIFNGIMILLIILMPTIIPSAYISSSIAQEKEKRTLEGLLTLPHLLVLEESFQFLVYQHCCLRLYMPYYEDYLAFQSILVHP